MDIKNKKERDWLDITEDEEKPEWLKRKEKAESIGNFVLWLFTDINGIILLLFILGIPKLLPKIDGEEGLDLFFTVVVIYAGIGIYKTIRFIHKLYKTDIK